MSLLAVRHALDANPGTAMCKMVLVAMAAEADEEGVCEATAFDLMQRANCSRMSLYSASKALRAAGHISLVRRTARGNHYRINLRGGGA